MKFSVDVTGTVKKPIKGHLEDGEACYPYTGHDVDAGLWVFGNGTYLGA
jgi:hypothetical protein